MGAELSGAPGVTPGARLTEYPVAFGGMMSDPAHNPARPPALRFIFVTLMLDVLGFGLLIPVGPKLVESLLHGGHGGTDAEASTMFSILMSTWYAMSFLFASILGALSDRFGRRPVILI